MEGRGDGEEDRTHRTFRWRTVLQGTLGSGVAGIVVMNLFVRRERKRLSKVLVGSVVQQNLGTVLSGSVAGAAAGSLFFATREVLRTQVQWPDVAIGACAGTITGAAAGACIGGPSMVVGGMSTIGGLAALGEGCTSLYSQWYKTKRKKVYKQRLLERQEMLLQEKAALGEEDVGRKTLLDQQLGRIAAHLNSIHEQELEQTSKPSMFEFELPSWFPLQRITDEELEERREEDAITRELMDRYHAIRQRERQQEMEKQNDQTKPSPEESQPEP